MENTTPLNGEVVAYRFLTNTKAEVTMAIMLSTAKMYPKVLSADVPESPSVPAGPVIPGNPSVPVGPVKLGTVIVVFVVVVDVDTVRSKVPFMLVGMITMALKLPYVSVVMSSV